MIRPILLVVFVLAQVFLVAVPRHDTLDLEAWPNARLSPRIFGERTVGQSFIAGRNGLSRVDVFLATYLTAPPGDVIFRLFEGEPAGSPIAEARVSGSKLRDNLFNPFEFRRVARSKGKRFSFTLSVPTASEANGPSVWMNPGRLCPKARSWSTAVPLPATAIFRTYSRRTILAEWARISKGAPGFLGNPFVLALAALLFEIAAAAVFWRILGLFFRNGENSDA